MKKIILTIIVTALILALTANQRFSSDLHRENVIIVAFNADAINSTTGELNITRNQRGIALTGLHSFDLIANRYNFTEIERMFTVKDTDFKDKNGVHLMNIFRINVSDNIDQAIYELSNDPNVIYANFEPLITNSFVPNDPHYDNQWHLPKINVNEIWNRSVGDSTIVIAVVDNGVKWNHEDLRANIFINHAEAPGVLINWDSGVITGGDGIDNDGNGRVDDVLGWDFYHNNRQTYQSFAGMDHGTHVAGIAGAVGNNAIGISGVAMDVKILVSKHGPSNYYSMYLTDAFEGILYAADTGAHIINCSWGGASGPPGIEYADSVVDYALGKGAIVVAASGNNGAHNEYVIPAAATNAVGVASSDQYDNKSSFSNYGQYITVTAPGSEIFSTSFIGSLQTAIDSYTAHSGTSMATPVVTGAIALMKSVHPELSVEQIKSRLHDSADIMPQNESGGLYQGLLGGGRLNAYKAIFIEEFVNLSLIDDIEVYEIEGDGDGIPNIGETLAIGITLRNQEGWSDALETQAVIQCDMPGVDILQPNISFPSNIYSGTDISSTENAIIKIEPTVNTLIIPLRITVSAKSTNNNDFDKTFRVDLQLSMSKANWPLLTTAESSAAPMLANLDGTGMRLVNIAGNILHVVDENKKYNPGFPLSLNNESIFSDFAIGDVLGNGKLQIVVGTNNGSILIIDENADIVNQVVLGNGIRRTPIIADLNNDGKNEIVVGTLNGTLFVLNGHDLSTWENFPISVGGNILSNMAVGDVTGDGVKNIIINIMGTSQRVLAINPLTGENIQGFPYYEVGASNAGSTLANISGEGALNIIFATSQVSTPSLVVLNGDGTVFANSIMPTQIMSEIAPVDLNNDGNILLIFTDTAGNIWAKDKNMVTIDGFPVRTTNRIEASPVFMDIDNDGKLEIIVGDDNGFLHILRSDGTYFPGYPIKITPHPIKKSAFAGFFNNTNSDILITTITGIEYIETKQKGATPFWNTFRGNIGKSASFEDAIMSDFEIPIPRVYTNLEQNFPNPFNPVTKIRFYIQKDEDVTLNIYNIRGQLVKALLNEKLKYGQHEIIWNGDDGNGRNVASGIYFYKLTAGDFVDVKRMVMMK